MKEKDSGVDSTEKVPLIHDSRVWELSFSRPFEVVALAWVFVWENVESGKGEGTAERDGPVQCVLALSAFPLSDRMRLQVLYLTAGGVNFSYWTGVARWLPHGQGT